MWTEHETDPDALELAEVEERSRRNLSEQFSLDLGEVFGADAPSERFRQLEAEAAALRKEAARLRRRLQKRRLSQFRAELEEQLSDLGTLSPLGVSEGTERK